MERFPLPLLVKLSAKGKTAELIGPFIYIDPQVGPIEVPAGSLTDFASVDAVKHVSWAVLLLAVLLSVFCSSDVAVWLCSALYTIGGLLLLLHSYVVGQGNAAAAVHDWLYSVKIKQVSTRAAADRVLRNALISTVRRELAWVFWVGVRLGGYWHYRK